MKETFGTSFVPRMHMDRSRIVAKIGTESNTRTVMRGTMIYMAPNITSPPDIILQVEAGM
jgi:hypothetical protein